MAILIKSPTKGQAHLLFFPSTNPKPKPSPTPRRRPPPPRQRNVRRRRRLRLASRGDRGRFVEARRPAPRHQRLGLPAGRPLPPPIKHLLHPPPQVPLRRLAPPTRRRRLASLPDPPRRRPRPARQPHRRRPTPRPHWRRRPQVLPPRRQPPDPQMRLPQRRPPTSLDDVFGWPDNYVAAALCRAHACGTALKSFFLAGNLQIPSRDCHNAVLDPP